MTIKNNPTVLRKNSKTYKLAANEEIMQEMAKLCVEHTLEMFHVPATAQGMPSMDAIVQSMSPLKILLAGIASSEHVANREVKPHHLNGITFQALVSAGYFVVEFGETVRDEVNNTIHRYGYRLSFSDETGLPLIMKLSAVYNKDGSNTSDFVRKIDLL